MLLSFAVGAAQPSVHQPRGEDGKLVEAVDRTNDVRGPQRLVELRALGHVERAESVCGEPADGNDARLQIHDGGRSGLVELPQAVNGPWPEELRHVPREQLAHAQKDLDSRATARGEVRSDREIAQLSHLAPKIMLYAMSFPAYRISLPSAFKTSPRLPLYLR